MCTYGLPRRYPLVEPARAEDDEHAAVAGPVPEPQPAPAERAPDSPRELVPATA